SEHADPQSQIQGQLVGHAPVVLEVGLKRFLAVVILHDVSLLPKAGDVAHQQVGERVSRADRGIAPVEGEIAGSAAGTKLSAQFVLLPESREESELQVVAAHDLGYVIAQRIGRIGVVGSVGNVARVLAKVELGAASGQVNARNNRIGAKYSKQCSHIHVGRTLPAIGIWETRVEQDDVVGRIADHKLVQQRGRSGSVQACYQAYTRTIKVGANGGEVAGIGPQRNCRLGIPGIVNVVEAEPVLGVDVLVNSQQLFPPIRRLNRRSHKATARVRRRNQRILQQPS